MHFVKWDLVLKYLDSKYPWVGEQQEWQHYLRTYFSEQMGLPRRSQQKESKFSVILGYSYGFSLESEEAKKQFYQECVEQVWTGEKIAAGVRKRINGNRATFRAERWIFGRMLREFVAEAQEQGDDGTAYLRSWFEGENLTLEGVAVILALEGYWIVESAT